MELRHLRYFIAVAEELHFGHAAARLHLAQPPLTRQIQQLEAELKVTLFQRTKRRVQLTRAGEVLLAEARALMTAADNAVAAAQRAARGESGRLAIGFVGTATYEVLPVLLRPFHNRYPAVDIALSEMSSQEQAPAIHERRIHVGLMRPSLPDRSIATLMLQQEPLVAAVWEGHPLAERPQIALNALRDENFVLYPIRPKPNFADQLVEFCVQAGFVPRVVQEAQETQTAISLVAAGIGVTLAPHSVEKLGWPGVVYRPIAPPAPLSELIAAYRPDEESPVLKAFLDVARETMPLARAR